MANKQFNDRNFIPRCAAYKFSDLKIKGYNVYSLCNGELFDVIYSCDSIFECLKLIKHIKAKYFDDVVIEVLFEKQQ